MRARRRPRETGLSRLGRGEWAQVEATFTPTVRIDCGDALALLRREADESVDCVVTSPPYWGLRDYGVAGQIGLEGTPEAYAARLVEVFREVRRVLRETGTLWLNLGDSYTSGNRAYRDADDFLPARGRATRAPTPLGLKSKDLVGIPWRVAFALQADGWWLRSDIVWSKPNPMPESVTDRPTRAHEYVFLLTKAARYWYDADAIAEPAVDGDPTRPRGSVASLRRRQAHPQAGRRNKQGDLGKRTYSGFNARWDAGDPKTTRNCRDVWIIPTQPFSGAHFATMPEALVERCILAGCPEGGTVLDPFVGSGTVCAVAARLGRHSLGFEMNERYVRMARKRAWVSAQPRMAFGGVAR